MKLNTINAMNYSRKHQNFSAISHPQQFFSKIYCSADHLDDLHKLSAANGHIKRQEFSVAHNILDTCGKQDLFWNIAKAKCYLGQQNVDYAEQHLKRIKKPLPPEAYCLQISCLELRGQFYNAFLVIQKIKDWSKNHQLLLKCASLLKQEGLATLNTFWPLGLGHIYSSMLIYEQAQQLSIQCNQIDIEKFCEINQTIGELKQLLPMYSSQQHHSMTEIDYHALQIAIQLYHNKQYMTSLAQFKLVSNQFKSTGELAIEADCCEKLGKYHEAYILHATIYNQRYDGHTPDVYNTYDVLCVYQNSLLNSLQAQSSQDAQHEQYQNMAQP